MRFTILGAVTARHDDRELELRPPTLLSLLAVLLVAAGRPVSFGEIVDALWGQDPPASATNLVHRHIGMLRRLIEPGLPLRAPGRLLAGGVGGYRLTVDAETFDLLRFRELVDRGRAEVAAGRAPDAMPPLLAALELRSGPVAAGVPERVRGQPAFVAVDREYLDALRLAADTALTCQVSGQVLPNLRRAAADNPLHEGLHAALVLALAATGHRADALGAYRTVRTRLVEELGIDPGPELRAAHERVLQQSTSDDLVRPEPAPAPAPAGPADQAGPGAGPWVVPDQLPPDLPGFTGRDAEIARARAAAGTPRDGLLISAICGMAGIGKTTLAVALAHRIADRFPDGRLHLNLRGFDPTGSPVDPAEALQILLEGLGVPPARMPTSTDARTGLYRSLLAGRRVLVVADNARDSAHVRPLLPGSAGCMVIVTSRSQLHDLVSTDGADLITLDLPDHAEARQALLRRLGADRVRAEPDAVDAIISRCGRLPLALGIVAARAAAYPSFSLASIADGLGAPVLDGSAAGPAADPRSVFSWSYGALPPAAARAFRLLALHPGPDIGLVAATCLIGGPRREVRAALDGLIRIHLIGESAPGRYTAHDLVREYAADLVGELDGAETRQAASRRMFDHYLRSATAAAELMFPARRPVPVPEPGPGASPDAGITGSATAQAWMRAELAVLPRIVTQAVRTGFGEHASALAVALELFLDRSGRRRGQLDVQRAVLTGARDRGDRRAQAEAARALGFALGRVERFAEADERLAEALRLFGELDDADGCSRTYRSMAFLANAVGDHEAALGCYRRALRGYRAIGDRAGQAWVSNETGWTLLLLGRYREAVGQCRAAVEAHRESGSPQGLAAAADSLGLAHHRLGEYDRALEFYRLALDVYEQHNDRYLVADTLGHLADTHEALGDPGTARATRRRALSILAELGHPDADALRAALRSE